MCFKPIPSSSEPSKSVNHFAPLWQHLGGLWQFGSPAATSLRVLWFLDYLQVIRVFHFAITRSIHFSVSISQSGGSLKIVDPTPNLAYIYILTHTFAEKSWNNNFYWLWNLVSFHIWAWLIYFVPSTVCLIKGWERLTPKCVIIKMCVAVSPSKLHVNVFCANGAKWIVLCRECVNGENDTLWPPDSAII